jgi:hypothetical protein
MSWKTALILVLLAAGLGGFFLYDVYRLGPARDKTESAKGRLWAVEPKDVEALAIKRQRDTIRLRRVEGGWEMIEPVKARGDRGPIDEVVTSLATLRMDREIDPGPARLADFGLDPPAAEVRLDVKGRAEPLTLSVGARSPTGAWVYAREGSRPGVVTVAELVARDVERPVADFRDKTVVAFDRKNVTAMDLEVGGDRVSLVSEEPGRWRIVKPAAYRADGELVGAFLERLESAKVKEFVDEAPRSLRPYGLDRPVTVTLWIGKDKERASKTVLFGGTDKGKQAVYVMRAGEPPVMLAPEELWTALPKTAAALRDKVVMPYAFDKVSRVELEHGGGRVVLERDGAGWKITAPETLGADTGAVTSLLWRIRDLRAVGFLADAPGEISRYLGKPDVTVRVREEGAPEPKTLLLRSSPETRGGQPVAIAAVQGQGPVMLVDGKAIADLSRSATDLRDKSILPAFEMSDVKRARVSAAGTRLLVERRGADEWTVLEPSRGPAKEGQVANLLLTLKALRWKDIASAAGEDAARFGLDKPELEVSLLGADGRDLATLLVGRQEGARTYVRSRAAPAIYAVDSKQLESLRKAPSEIGR